MIPLVIIRGWTVAGSWKRRSKQQTETGRVVNIMSADVNNIIQFFYPMMAQLVVAPCILIAALVLLWFQIRCVPVRQQ